MSESTVCLLGLPGLYQNWLAGSIDPESNILSFSNANFFTKTSRIVLFEKNKTTACPQDFDIVFNLYVKEENFPWYLYNFLEKTDHINIVIDNLIDDLFSKAPGTIAFDFMLRHFVKTYNINPDSSREIKFNSLIEYFYFLLLDKQSEFKIKTSTTFPGAVNIEYSDFNNKETLWNKIKHVSFSDRNWFDNSYQNLKKKNSRYLNKSKNFVDNLTNNTMDAIEIAYCGFLVSTITKETLDWYNLGVRAEKIARYKQDLIDLALKLNKHSV